jgi:uncharacterized protein (TIGR02145 family)
MKKQIVFLGLFLVLAIPCRAQMSLAVLEPEGKGLSKDEMWMLSLVQSSIAADINKYSSITIIDRQNLEAIIAEQKRSLSAMTSDEAIRIGNLANASHILIGKITKTPKAFMLELSVTDVETGKRMASHSPKSVTPDAVENLSAIKEASADLLKQLGVSLTDSQLEELKGPAASAQVQAQTALAHGVVAQRQGTSVAALSYYYQAAAFDPTLAEAVSRSSVMSANISGTNLGDNIRNDIVWRKNWVEQLKETEETFSKIINTADPPYTLFYSTNIETKNINYQNETADLSISLNLTANLEWFKAMQRSLRAAQAVMNGLNATNRKKDWGLDEWPMNGVSSTNPFEARKRNNYGQIYYDPLGKQYDIPVEFELVNQRGRAIGKQTIRLNPSFSISNNFIVKFAPNSLGILTFNGVNANEISDKLTIRVASVSGAAPKTAKFAITAISGKEWPKNPIKRTAFTDSRNGKKYGAVEIGIQTWMTENLNYEAEGSKCYDNDPANCEKYGRLYDWNTALTACPKGWHLPSDAEWTMLTDFVGGSSTAWPKLKAKSGWNSDDNGSDEFGFAALPGGYSGSYFSCVGSSGAWWSATEYSADNAYIRYMGYSNGDVYGNNSYKYRLFSVRCLQD